MSTSEEDIQLGVFTSALKPKSLLADTAHHFGDRRILQVMGDLNGLEDIATAAAPRGDERGRFVSLLTSDGRHARKWDGQAMRLGLLPDHRCVLGRGILPQEAGYHRLLGCAETLAPEDIDRRVLPVRVDPRTNAIPVMAGAPILAEGREIATMLDQEGLYGVAIVTLEPWREALHIGTRITCLNEAVLISWPTWLSSESEGRVGPAGRLI